MEPEISLSIIDDAITVKNKNTTVGYARFCREQKVLEYIFVNPAFRRKGYGKMLVRQIEHEIGGQIVPAPPLSKMGLKFFKAVNG